MIVANFEEDNFLNERVKDESRASQHVTCYMLQLVTLSHKFSHRIRCNLIKPLTDNSAYAAI